jgi:AcrR family transcriptional regulator
MQEKNELVKNQILSAAMTVFKKWGMHKSTMEDIAKAAGKGKSTLYYYYKNKEDVFEEAARIEMDYCFNLAASAIVGISSAKAQLATYIATVFKELRVRAEFYGVLVQEVRDDSKLITKLMSYYDSMTVQAVENIVKTGVKSREFVFANTDEQARAVFIIALILRNLQTEFIVYKPLNDLNPYIDMITRILTSGISS